ncbi:hypothetical protein HJG60_008309 [Phyllostomus discolor]|uniref:Uncharacterized protein n=1 Tax=Phyllostomus discolor TaxID=89673 RepID=A0A833Z6W7_9CHIR|nr:hypothetical protein HJG60_008309 [Phyllostomus discolor]
MPILTTTATAFTSIAGLLVLALCHIAVGQQMNLHWLHKMGLVVTLVSTVVVMSAVAQLWEDEWEVLLISLQGTAPFLHMGALAALTALSWIMAGQFPPGRVFLLPDGHPLHLLCCGVCPLPGPSHLLLSLHHGEEGPGPQACPHWPPRCPHDTGRVV